MVGKDPCYSISKELKKYISKEIQNKKFQENEISYSLLHICRRKLRYLDCGMVSEAVCLIADAAFIFCFFSIICSKLGNFVKSLCSLLYHKFFMCLCHVFLFKKTKRKNSKIEIIKEQKKQNKKVNDGKAKTLKPKPVIQVRFVKEKK